jgi:hypothetical protein
MFDQEFVVDRWLMSGKTGYCTLDEAILHFIEPSVCREILAWPAEDFRVVRQTVQSSFGDSPKMQQPHPGHSRDEAAVMAVLMESLRAIQRQRARSVAVPLRGSGFVPQMPGIIAILQKFHGNTNKNTGEDLIWWACHNMSWSWVNAAPRQNRARAEGLASGGEESDCEPVEYPPEVNSPEARQGFQAINVEVTPHSRGKMANDTPKATPQATPQAALKAPPKATPRATPTPKVMTRTRGRRHRMAWLPGTTRAKWDKALVSFLVSQDGHPYELTDRPSPNQD